MPIGVRTVWSRGRSEGGGGGGGAYWNRDALMAESAWLLEARRVLNQSVTVNLPYAL